jgi:anti-sigma-K factor RskA
MQHGQSGSDSPSHRPDILQSGEARPRGADTALRWWRAGTLAASAVAIVLAVIVVLRGSPAPPPVPVVIRVQPAPPLVAVLTAPAGGGMLTVSYDSMSRHIVAAPQGLAIGNSTAELWVIPADGVPRSLGVIADMVPSWTQPSAAAASAIAAGATLAVSVEPLGGSPTGRPTGKVILTGRIVAT